MTKEELKQEAEEYATKRASKFYTRNMWDRHYQTYIDSAEPREKQITILSKHILELQADKGHLTDKVRELEQQIEKMRCCQNCSHLCGLCELGIDGCYVCSKWNLRR